MKTLNLFFKLEIEGIEPLQEFLTMEVSEELTKEEIDQEIEEFQEKWLVEKTTSTYQIIEDDTSNYLKEDLEKYPIEVVIEMLNEQERQGNTRDVKVFQDSHNADKEEGGFDWEVSNKGYRYWSNLSDKYYYEFD